MDFWQVAFIAFVSASVGFGLAYGPLRASGHITRRREDWEHLEGEVSDKYCLEIERDVLADERQALRDRLAAALWENRRLEQKVNLPSITHVYTREPTPDEVAYGLEIEAQLIVDEQLMRTGAIE